MMILKVHYDTRSIIVSLGLVHTEIKGVKSIFLIFVSAQYNSLLNLLGAIPFLGVNVSLLFTYLSELQHWSLDFVIFGDLINTKKY